MLPGLLGEIVAMISEILLESLSVSLGLLLDM